MMKKWIQNKIMLRIMAGVALSCQLTGKPFELAENSWDNPTFINWFVGTYAFNGQINPQINREEQTLFREVAPLMASSPGEAVARIRSYMDGTMQADPEGDSAYSPALDYTIANLYLQAGEREEAIRNYERALARFPTFQRAYQNLGLTHVQAGDYERAIPALTKSIELGGTGGVVWGLLGFSYLNTDRPTQALTAYEQALVFQPDSRDWRLGKLNALLDSGERAMAIALLDELLKENSTETSLWMQQANAFLGEGRMQEAAANLEWLARSGTASGQSLALLGDIYLEEGLPDLSLNAYRAALANGGIGVDRLLRMVDGLSTRGATGQAVDFLQAVQTELKDSLTPGQELKALNLEARLALIKGLKEEAAEILERIISQDPLNGSALLSLGDYYSEIGEKERAILQYERAAEVDAVQTRALLALSRLYVQQRDYRTALVHLREANRLEPRAYVADYITQLEQAVRSL